MEKTSKEGKEPKEPKTPSAQVGTDPLGCAIHFCRLFCILNFINFLEFQEQTSPASGAVPTDWSGFQVKYVPEDTHLVFSIVDINLVSRFPLLLFADIFSYASTRVLSIESTGTPLYVGSSGTGISQLGNAGGHS